MNPTSKSGIGRRGKKLSQQAADPESRGATPHNGANNLGGVGLMFGDREDDMGEEAQEIYIRSIKAKERE
jgi:hypothetical protein